QAAQRELAEELGLVAEKWTSLGMTDPFTATASSPTSLWLAEDLTQTDRNPDASEIIELVTLPLTEIMKLVDRSEITHAPSIICILKSWIFKQM
ncbi:MAG: ADP-ribose pyrophosphatase, partial [Planctomycetota bacterium]